MAFALTACAESHPGGTDFERDMAENLEGASPDSVHVVQLSDLVPGDWDAAAVVCDGVPSAQLSDFGEGVLIGLVDYESPGFQALIVYLREGRVLDFDNLGQDVYFSPSFTPCPFDENAVNSVVEMARSDAALPLTFNEVANRWLISDEDFHILESRS